MLNIKVITLVLLPVGSAVIGGAGMAIYVNSTPVIVDTMAILNYKPEQHPTGTFRHVNPVSIGRDKGC